MRVNIKGYYMPFESLRGCIVGGFFTEDEIRNFPNLADFKSSLFGVLNSAKEEIPQLRQAIIEGRIDGSTYEGTCACLKGTIANIRQCDAYRMKGIKLNTQDPIEVWFMNIKVGDTPENSVFAELAVMWIDEYTAVQNLTWLDIING